MYSPQVIAARQQTLERRFASLLPPGGLVRHPVSLCHQMVSELAPVWDAEERKQTRPLSVEEETFRVNETLLAKIDYRYAAERYISINFEGQALKPLYPFWESQELILEALARVEQEHWETNHPDGILANILKGRQLGACLDPSTRVLTADLRWVPIADLPVGAEVVAVDEQIRGGKGPSRRMRTGVVEAKWETGAPAFEILFASGASVVASASHRWLYRTRTQTHAGWREVERMKVGGHVRRVTTPWGLATLDDARMGGLLDGEGSCNVKVSGGAEVCFSQRAGAVYDWVRQYSQNRGYAGKEDPDNRPDRPSKFGTQPVGRVSWSRMDEIFRLLGQTRPIRFIGRYWWEGKELPGTAGAWERIVAIRPVGHRRLIDLQTSTKTFIAEGLVSHNSTLVQSLLAHRCLTHQHVRTLIASDVPQNSGSEGLFGMLELVVEQWPWWLKPRERFHTKNKHIMWDNGSRVIVESGKSMKGGLMEEGGEKGQIGRSKTYSAVHLSEITTWERPEQINSSLLPAIPHTPRTLCIRESTAMGRNNYWHQEWNLAQGGDDPRFINIFIPWYAEQSKYRLPCPPDWIPADETLQFARRAQAEGPLYMHRPVTLSKEQLRWYELNRRAAIKRDELYKFLSEYPAEPEEAFQNSGRSIFSIETLTRIQHQARPIADLLLVAPRAELLADKEASIAEFRESQRQLTRRIHEQQLHAEAAVVGEGPGELTRVETPTLTEIEPAETPQ